MCDLVESFEFSALVNVTKLDEKLAKLFDLIPEIQVISENLKDKKISENSKKLKNSLIDFSLDISKMLFDENLKLDEILTFRTTHKNFDNFLKNINGFLPKFLHIKVELLKKLTSELGSQEISNMSDIINGYFFDNLTACVKLIIEINDIEKSVQKFCDSF